MKESERIHQAYWNGLTAEVRAELEAKGLDVTTKTGVINLTVQQSAPTAEMIRLYDEMRAKALESVLAIYRTTDTTVDSVITVLGPMGASAEGGQDIHIIFRLNGEEVKLKINLSMRDSMLTYDNGEALGKLVFGKIAERVTETLVEQALRGNPDGGGAVYGLKELFAGRGWR